MRQMVKASRPAVKTLTLIKSRDIVADRMLKPCEEGDHSKCTGWAVLRREVSPIDANYFLKCTCTCHHQHKKELLQIRKKRFSRKQLKKRIKKKAKKKQKPRRSKKSKSRKARRR